MRIFKCKICGGSLNILPGETIAQCEFCGTKQTLPKLDDDRKLNLYDRANHFRRNNDYDKAMGIYEQILDEDKTDAEAYWSIVLCRYGIEYVKDPVLKKRVPTINRMQYKSILADEDYKSAIKYADESQRSIYESEANTIDKIQKGILEISQKEQPFDVFICYKESDNSGRRTADSVLGQELYYGLIKEGFNVFFSRITLEKHLGSEYEPYIFAALNSAKVMVVLGTCPENFNSIWVKNEWSRFLALINKDNNKVLIPAFKDMDPYELPDDFSHLQAQDMNKLGFMQDLIYGIKKITGKNNNNVNVQLDSFSQHVFDDNLLISPLVKRTFIFLEDGDFDSANEYAEKVLDNDPENARGYMAKLLASRSLNNEEQLKRSNQPIEQDYNYIKALKYAKGAYKNNLEHLNDCIKNNILQEQYDQGLAFMQTKDYDRAMGIFTNLGEFRDAKQKIEQCQNDFVQNIYEQGKMLVAQKKYNIAIALFNKIKQYRDVKQEIKQANILWSEDIYVQADSLLNSDKYLDSIPLFNSIIKYKDSKQKIEQANQRKKESLEKTKKKKKTIIKIISIVTASVLAIVLCCIGGVNIARVVDIKNRHYMILELNDTQTGYVVMGFDKAQKGEIVIPSSYKGKPVVEIRQSAFYKNQDITSVVIPGNIIVINKYAFSNCNNLKTIKIEQGVENIYFGAFDSCQNLTNIYLPKEIDFIDNCIFSECYKANIYCEENSQPDSWADNWDKVDRDNKVKVVWKKAS